MSLPNELVLVRHGHSEGNLAFESSKAGDHSLFTQEFREKPGSRWRLTTEGRNQAKTAGKWISENISKKFDKYYVSPYARTRETAGLLGLTDAQWLMSQRLRERDWGDITSMPTQESITHYPLNALVRQTDKLYWRPPGGESIADVRLRVRDLLGTLFRECDGQRVVVVTHGEFIIAARAELEYITDEQWIASTLNPSHKIYNAQVIHYTRLNPNTGETIPYFGWVRSVCPWMDGVDTGWEPIERIKYSNEDLLEQVDDIRPITSL